MGKLNNLKLWSIFFLYTFCVSAFVEFILLPYFFPGFYAGHGLLKSSFDSIGFHKLAAAAAEKIRIQGWSAWQFRPQLQSPAGIASIFYVLITPDPRALIPLNAALHAGAALILVNLLNLFLKNKAKAILCVLPFLMFPSNLQWTAQWHRDGFSILGVVLMIQSMVLSCRLWDYEVKGWLRVIFYALIYFVFGFASIWLVRPYLLTIMKVFVELFFVLLFLNCLLMAFKNKALWQRLPPFLLFIWLIFFLFEQIKVPSLVYPRTFAEKAPTVDSKKNKEFGYGNISKAGEQNMELIADKIAENQWAGLPGETKWQATSWLPEFVEKKCYYLARTRGGFCLSAPGAMSNIDHDVGFENVKDIVAYLPRAGQIAFLAPFPNQWLSAGTYLESSLMRKISGFEMIFVYFTLIFLPYAIWYWRKSVEIWVISIFCIYMLFVYGLVVCNVGSLYRMRYVYLTTLVALGIAGFMAFLGSVKRDRAR